MSVTKKIAGLTADKMMNEAMWLKLRWGQMMSFHHLQLRRKDAGKRRNRGEKTPEENERKRRK